MSQLDGKQIRNESTSLDKLKGHSGLVVFTASATMSFDAGSALRQADENIIIGTDVVNKNYVDAVAQGLNIKESVHVISLSNITLSGTQSIDNYLLGVGDRVLVNGQAGVSATASNGIYVVATGSWTRAFDADGYPLIGEVQLGDFVFVSFGDTYAGTGWVLNTTDSPDFNILVGTESQKWTQFSSAGVITAGDGLSQLGNAFNVNTGTGLTISGDNVAIANTGVSANPYGAADTVATFTVNAQGQLTTAADVLIDITSGQVNNFTASSEAVIFTTGNFVDGSTVDFTVTAGDSVTAEVTLGSLTASRFNIINSASASQGWKLGYNTSGQFEWFDPSLSDISEVVAGNGLTGGGVSGAVTLDVQTTNGVSILNDAVALGGTLVQDTTVSGDSGSYSVTFDGVDNFLVTASSSFDVSVDNGLIILDAGNGGSVDIYGGDVLIYATGSVDIVSTQEVNLQTADYSLNFTGFGTVSVGGSTAGLVYTATPSNALPLTLIHKQYVDDAVANLGSGTIAGVTAGNGLSGGGTANYITLDVNLGINGGLTFSGLSNDYIVVDPNIAGTGLDFNSGVLTVNTSEITPLLAGAGLTSNGSVLDVQVDTSGLNINGSNQVALNSTITGDRTFADSVTINGNLTVLGTSSTIHTENLFVEDNIITLNATYSGPAIPYSGLEVNVGDGTYSTLLWEGSTGYWVAGVSGSENYVVTQAGNGLTQSFDTLSVDFTSVAESLQGNGLSASGGVLNIIGGTGISVDANGVSVNFTDVANGLDGAGLVANGTELDVNTGLGLTISSDAVAMVWGGTATGLTFSNNAVSVSVDGTTLVINSLGQLEATTQGDVQGVTAGAGLTGGGSSGFLTLDVNTDNGISILNDAVALGGTLSQNTTISGGGSFGLTFSSLPYFGVSGLSGPITFNGSGASSFNVLTGDISMSSGTDPFTITSGSTFSINLSGAGVITDNSGATQGLIYAADYSPYFVNNSLITKFYVDNLFSNLGEITGITAGNGLSGGGTSGFISLDVNTGLGLTISGDDVAMVWGGTATGLTFSGNAISANVDGTTIQVNSSGQLSVVAGSAQPEYSQMHLTPLATTANANFQPTGITLSYTPNDYSRISVFVNGQLQYLGNGISTTASSVDCYFSGDGGVTAKVITSIVAGDQLYWNGNVANAGFKLDASDRIDIVYER